MNITQNGQIFMLTGVIDEHSDFSPLLSQPAPLHLNFSGVQRINSIGLRTWMRFMTLWQDQEIYFEECPIVISDQLALLPALRGIKKVCAIVSHAVLSYSCPQCGHQDDIRIERSQAHPVLTPAATEPPCPKCGSPLEVDQEDNLSIFS